MITIADYWMGRNVTFATQMTPQLEKNAALTVDLANRLLAAADSCGVYSTVNPITGTHVNSGWRPAAINAATPNAAPNSKHMTGQAVDLADADGNLDEWLMTDAGQAALTDIGLWMEHPASTKGWSHVQTIPPGSGNRVFYP